MIRFFDILLSFFGIAILFPLYLIIYILIIIESKGNGIYIQNRVGINGNDFKLYKFRTMFKGSDEKGLITIGINDSRITQIGKFIRKYKIDELPQLFNVFIGDMSIVGPRPEVRKYVNLYNYEQLKVLKVRPGITDRASIQYRNEDEILGSVSNPDYLYINDIMPNKILLNMEYIEKKSLSEYFKIIFWTFYKFKSKSALFLLNLLGLTNEILFNI